MWLFYAFLSAVFAAATAILAKIGVSNINSHLATALRTTVILFITWGFVFLNRVDIDLRSISQKTYLFLFLSAVATGLSWLFYFRALQLGPASKVAPIDKFSLVLTIVLASLFLHEKITFPVVLGTSLITVGTLVIALYK